MSRCKGLVSLAVAPTLAVLLLALPVVAQTPSLQQAASSIESAIGEAMSQAGQTGQPTLGQLGGVQSGATGADAGAGAGGDSGSGGSGGVGGGSGGSGGSGGGGCFAPDTLVLMADGSTKRIADIVVGDKVASWDFDKDAMASSTVLQLYTVQRDYSYLVDGVSVTAEHPFCTAPGQFSEVHFLERGASVASVVDGELRFVPISEYEKLNKVGVFYNMTVSGTHTYFIKSHGRGFFRLVHNKGSCFSGDTLVLMASGIFKPIRDIVVGDEVASWDFKSGSQVAAVVRCVYKVERGFHYMVDGVHVTAEHPFCTGLGRYTVVRELTVGSDVAEVTDDGLQFVPVTNHDKIEQVGFFYNMTVGGAHNYIVSPPNHENVKRLVSNKGI